MRKHIAKCEKNSINLTFDKFIINVYKKKKLRSRNQNIFVNIYVNVKYYLSVEK